MNGKYVVIDYPNKGETIFIFPETMVHKDVAKATLYHANEWTGTSVISAGFIRMSGGRFICYGRSESLEIDSRPDEDGMLANKVCGIREEEVTEKSNDDRHFYLYAKMHYERRCTATELIKIQSKRCGVREKDITLRDVNITLIRLMYTHIKHSGALREFIDFIDNYANQGGIQLAISKACLIVLSTVSTDEIKFELGEADPSILPLAVIVEEKEDAKFQTDEVKRTRGK